MWMAGGGSRPGTIHGETDDFSYNIVKDPVHIHDFHATVLQLLGFDHRRFTYPLPGARSAPDRRRAGACDQAASGVKPTVSPKHRCLVAKGTLAIPGGRGWGG